LLQAVLVEGPVVLPLLTVLPEEEAEELPQRILL
jgi:hypothetical protein